jgi:predicted secreted protein
MAAICGTTGTTSLGVDVKNWVINYNLDTHDITDLGSNAFKEYIGCLKDIDGTFMSYDPVGGTGSKLSVSFTNDNDSFSGNLIVTNVKTSVSVDNVVTYDYTFSSTGTWTVT